MRQPQYYIFMENSWWCCCCCCECAMLQYYVYIIIIYVADFRKCTRLRMRFVNAVVCDRFVFTVACDSIFPIFRWRTTSSRITLQYYHIHRYSLQQQQNIDNNLSITLRERYFQTPFSRWRRWRWSVYYNTQRRPRKEENIRRNGFIIIPRTLLRFCRSPSRGREKQSSQRGSITRVYDIGVLYTHRVCFFIIMMFSCDDAVYIYVYKYCCARVL